MLGQKTAFRDAAPALLGLSGDKGDQSVSGRFPYPQVRLSDHPEPTDGLPAFPFNRLGKLVEAFVFHQLKQQAGIEWIGDNLQIQHGKITVGEIDALYYEQQHPVHLEVAYKFYLYDTIESYDHELAYWIGPNRNDSLFYKLEKLHRKQFALLRSEYTNRYLAQFQLTAADFTQKVCFKAQLFLPYHNRRKAIAPLNNDCVAGFYLAYRELSLLSTALFFIPTKLDWLRIPQEEVDWIAYPAAQKIIKGSIDEHRSPLVWLKFPHGELSKCFIVFW